MTRPETTQDTCAGCGHGAIYHGCDIHCDCFHFQPSPAADALLAVVEAARDVATEFRKSAVWGSSRNAPGHCHKEPPLWDDGRGCSRCEAWGRVLDALAQLDAARGE